MKVMRCVYCLNNLQVVPVESFTKSRPVACVKCGLRYAPELLQVMDTEMILQNPKRYSIERSRDDHGIPTVIVTDHHADRSFVR